MSPVIDNPVLPLILTGIITLAYLAIRKMFGHDSREPPLAPQSIPLIGHMLGLSRSKFNYYVDLSQQTGSPIFTMSLPGQKMYVVTKPELIQTVQKQHKILALTPIEAKFASTNVNGDEGDFGLSMESYAAMRAGLKPEIDNAVPLEDIARYEVGGSIAILVNTAPAAFWTLLLLYSHPGLLGDIRGEIDACTDTSTENGSTIKTLDITTLKENCPLLLSSYQEVLRFRSMGTSIREVMEDTYLDQWLLKKGAMLQMPSRIIHQDAHLWGADVADFNPRRFLPEEKHNRPRDVCFRAFGGGKTLCPGRHFATNEILAVVAVFIARLDMEPVDGSWKLPTTANTNVAAVVMEPDHDIQVEIKTRQGFEDVEWSINVNKSEKIFAMVTEDSGETEE